MELNYNRVHLCGQATDTPVLSHINHGCAFYRFTLSVLRLSGQADKLPVIVPKALLDAVPVAAGDTVTVIGQLRSFNNKSGQGSRLVISVFAHQLTPGGESPFPAVRCAVQDAGAAADAAGAGDLRHHSGGEPAVRPGGLPAVHRVGRSGRPDGGYAHRPAAHGGGTRPEPDLHKERERRADGADSLRGVHHASGGGRGVSDTYSPLKMQDMNGMIL